MCIYTYTCKYNLLSLYTAICMYVFRADHTHQLVWSFLGKTTSSTPSFTPLPRVLFAGLRSSLVGIASVNFGMAIGVITHISGAELVRRLKV